MNLHFDLNWDLLCFQYSRLIILDFNIRILQNIIKNNIYIYIMYVRPVTPKIRCFITQMEHF